MNLHWNADEYMLNAAIFNLPSCPFQCQYFSVDLLQFINSIIADISSRRTSISSGTLSALKSASEASGGIGMTCSLP